MTRRIRGTNGRPDLVLIEEEPPRACELCGSLEETRPYGPGSKRVCYSCAMKDREGTERRMAEALGWRTN